VALRDVLVADPEGTRRMEACFWTDRAASPRQLRHGVVMRWSVEVTGEEARAHRGVATQRH